MKLKEIQKRTLVKSRTHSSDLVKMVHIRDLSSDYVERLQHEFSISYQKSSKPLVVKSGNKKIEVTFEQILFLAPKKADVIVAERTNLFTLFLSAKAVNEAIAENKISQTECMRLTHFIEVLKPTPWLKALMNQYFYETVIMLDSPPGCTFFLEKQIINEVMRCLFANYYLKNEHFDSGIMNAEVYELIKYVESHLYEETLTVVQIAKALGYSESSLLRRFKEHVGRSPQNYIKQRRLEDAYRFIKEHKMSVSDACFTVGYSDFTSFSKSFKAEFGRSPSQV